MGSACCTAGLCDVTTAVLAVAVVRGATGS